ncbi:MAG: glycosyltransferase, partial [Candidatus Competibacteraceae bacterium]|nr:glycosyltransferase [Candidatus Competibacteraceae bacterium]
MTLRILLVSDHFPPFLGGAHRQSYLLSQQLAQRGHEVTVVTSWQPGVPDKEVDGLVTIYRLKELRTLVPAMVRDRHQRHHPPYPDPAVAWQ